MTFLLDVNVLIALIDPAHIGHNAAHRWFAMNGGAHWATCPITENGVIRVVGHPKYSNSPAHPPRSRRSWPGCDPCRVICSGATRLV